MVGRFDLTCTMRQVALGRVGESGAFTEVIASWRLGSTGQSRQNQRRVRSDDCELHTEWTQAATMQ